MVRSFAVALSVLVLMSGTAWGQSLVGLRIEGPDIVAEDSVAYYRVMAAFDNGREYEVTLHCSMLVEPGTYAGIGAFGDLHTYEVSADQVETLYAEYSFGGGTEHASHVVTITNMFRVLGVEPTADAELTTAPDAVVFEMGGTVDPNTVGPRVVAMYRSVDGVLGNGDDESIGPTAVTLSDPTHVSVDLTGVPMPDDNYQVILSDDSAGYALEFDGGQHVVVPNSPSLSITGSFTLEAWARLDDPNGPTQMLIFKGDDEGGWDPYYLGVENGKLKLGLHDDNNVRALLEADITTFDWSTFHHVAGVFDDEADEMILYVDGQSVAIGPTTLHPMSSQGGMDVAFGNSPGYPQFFSGVLDEIRIWNIARSKDDIRQDMHWALAGDDAGLVGYWAFDEGAGQTTADLSPFGNDGRLGSDSDPGGDSRDPDWVASGAPLLGLADVDGNQLDGEFDGSLPSGDGTAGGDFIYQFSIRRVAGAFKVAAVDPAPDSVVDVALASIEIDFTEDVYGASANDETIRLVRSVDGVFDNGDDEVVTPAGLTLSGLRHLSVDLSDQVLPDDLYQITLTGRGPGPGYALEFDGGQHVIVPNSASLSITGSFTLEAWARLDDPNGSAQMLIFKGDDRGGLDPYRIAALNGKLRFGFNDESNAQAVVEAATAPFDWSAFHHVAGVFDDEADQMILYIDGQPAATASTTLRPLADQTGMDVAFGNSPGYPQFLDGALDEIRIWNVARSGNDIRQDMDSPLVGDEPGLVGYWDLDEGAGQVAHDLTAYQNHGTLGQDADPGGDSRDPRWIVSGAAIPSGLVDLGGNVLDGEFVGTFPSGDDIEGGDFVYQFSVDQAGLVETDPPADGTLPKTEDNVIRLVFEWGIALPASGPALTIVELADPNNDVSDLFDYDLDPDDPNGATLLAIEDGPQLTNATWYRLGPAPGLGVEPFTLDLCVLWGDADDSGRVTMADYSQVKAHLGELTDARYDLNGTGRVTTSDYSVVKAYLGDRQPAKP